MSAPVCTSKWQCSVNGLAGTAVAISVMVLCWLGVELLSANFTGQTLGKLIWLWVVPFGPVVMSVLYAGLMRWQACAFRGFGLALTIGGAVWGVVMLNMMRHL